MKLFLLKQDYLIIGHLNFNEQLFVTILEYYFPQKYPVPGKVDGDGGCDKTECPVISTNMAYFIRFCYCTLGCLIQRNKVFTKMEISIY